MEAIEREEALIEREIARELWEDLKRDVFERTGGVRGITEDYRDFPRPLRRADGVSLDEAATHFDYEYADDFVQYCASVYNRYRVACEMKIPRPKFHEDRPDLQEILDLFYDACRWVINLNRAGIAKNTAESIEAYRLQRETRRQYKAACAELDLIPANV